MNQSEILEKFTVILRDLLSDDTITLAMDTTRGMVPNWDSFSYITFIATCEMQLGIRFKISDVESFSTVGDIVSEAARLLSK
jgi:acyl carrier protein